MFNDLLIKQAMVFVLTSPEALSSASKAHNFKIQGQWEDEPEASSTSSL